MDPLDYNFAHSIAVFASTSKSGEALETRDAVLTHNNAPIAEFNQCFLKNPTYKLERTLSRIDVYQRRVKVPLRLQVSSEQQGAQSALLGHGCILAGSVPGMSLPLGDLPSIDCPALSISTVQDAELLEEYGRLAFSAFGFPVNLAPVAFTSELLALPHVELFLGRVGPTAACCSMLLATGPVAGVYWVGVDEKFRRRGFGAAITAHALQVARSRGLRTATLQASKEGEPVYRRLGFRTIREYLRFDLLVR